MYMQHPVKNLQLQQCNIPIYFCNIDIQPLQHISETSETLETYSCNMRFQQNLASKRVDHYTARSSSGQAAAWPRGERWRPRRAAPIVDEMYNGGQQVWSCAARRPTLEKVAASGNRAGEVQRRASGGECRDGCASWEMRLSFFWRSREGR